MLSGAEGGAQVWVWMQHGSEGFPGLSARSMSDFGCENAAAIAAAPNVFTSMDDMARKRCDWRPHEGYPSGLLGPSCHLFARKCAHLPAPPVTPCSTHLHAWLASNNII